MRVLFTTPELKVKNKQEHQSHNTTTVPSITGNVAKLSIFPQTSWSHLVWIVKASQVK